MKRIIFPPAPFVSARSLTRNLVGKLSARAALRATLAAVLAMALAACSSSDDDDDNEPDPDAPVFTSADEAATPENTTDVFYTATADDPNGETVTFSIDGGDDAAFFSITEEGELSFREAPDFETPEDGDGNNTYLVTLAASNTRASATLDLRVRVADIVVDFALRRIASGLNRPVYVLGRGDGSNRIFIVEQRGQVEILDLDTGLLNPVPFLDISSSISTGDEQGLLGMALAPDFETSGVFYVYVTNVAGNSEIRQYEVDASDPDIADILTQDVIFGSPQNAANHNGGWIGFGPDELLYTCFGDGGGSNDQFNNGQNLATVLAAVTRIDPSGDDFASDGQRDYIVPRDNPFVDRPGARPEIVAYGLRNPFRCSFDRRTGDFYMGDVGEGRFEEINRLTAENLGAEDANGETDLEGLNFGWPLREGLASNRSGSAADPLTPPIAVYSHGTGARQGRSVTGGYVYRGPVEALQGVYVFADFINDVVFGVRPEDINENETVEAAGFIELTAEFQPDVGALENISSFGEDDAGNLFVVSLNGDIFRFEED